MDSVLISYRMNTSHTISYIKITSHMSSIYDQSRNIIFISHIRESTSDVHEYLFQTKKSCRYMHQLCENLIPRVLNQHVTIFWRVFCLIKIQGDQNVCLRLLVPKLILAVHSCFISCLRFENNIRISMLSLQW